ncbi:MAG TPA: YetF domain-containing protein [Thermoleophilaceae bacterium]|jgi:uncharacterized membrane protein YcaP (DUF421 family)|nr:YetF domain-containing protein [Thermoleophilaceae bacterium]
MDIALRALFLFFVIFVVLRAVGRRELSRLEPFDFVLLIVLGDAVQQGLTQDDYSVTGAVIVVATIAIVQVGVAYAGYRFGGLKTLLRGQPVVLVDDGKLVEANLKRERIRPDEVAEEARKQQIASIEQIRWALLEPSGDISVIPNARD